MVTTYRSPFSLFRGLFLGLVVVVASTTTSCGFITDSLMTASPEAPIDNRESYLEKAGGPQTTVDLGAGEEQLLTRFQTVLEEKKALERREQELDAEVEALRGSLRAEKEKVSVEQRLRAGAEAEAERLRRTKDERELKILHLQMQLANMQGSKLQLEIAGIERQIEQLNQQAAQPAAPMGNGR